MRELALAGLVDDERERTSIHRRQLGRAGVLRGAVEEEIDRGDVGDGVIEGREAGGLGLELAAHSGANQDERSGDAGLLEHGHDERRLVFAVAPAARERVRAGSRLVAVDPELQRDIARLAARLRRRWRAPWRVRR